MTKGKAVVGMSGGVDSSVSAYLLKEAGFEVVGVSLITREKDAKSEKETADAKKAADIIGIPHYTINVAKEFRENVLLPFVRAYVSGLTPNPCILCNPTVKWQGLLLAARDFGADFVATGHYAKIFEKNGRLTLGKPADTKKDQSYMLYRLSQDQLAHTLFPLADKLKTEVREIAKNLSLNVAEKKDSQEICFVEKGAYPTFVEENLTQKEKEKFPAPGDFVDKEGNVLGRHRGIHHYTIGQRKGLGIALGYPAYVLGLDAEKNRVILGEEKDLFQDEIFADNLNLMSIAEFPRGEKISCTVKVRYAHPGEKAIIQSLGEQVRITFAAPVRAPAPGQSAVFYDDEACIIGGASVARLAAQVSPCNHEKYM